MSLLDSFKSTLLNQLHLDQLMAEAENNGIEAAKAKAVQLGVPADMVENLAGILKSAASNLEEQESSTPPAA